MKARVAFVKLQSCLDISQRRDERQDYNPDKGVERRIHQADRREENAQSAVSCIERGSKRSGDNQKKRLQYLAAGTAGTTAPQKTGYGAVTDRAAGLSMLATTALFWTFIRPINQN